MLRYYSRIFPRCKGEFSSKFSQNDPSDGLRRLFQAAGRAPPARAAVGAKPDPILLQKGAVRFRQGDPDAGDGARQSCAMQLDQTLLQGPQLGETLPPVRSLFHPVQFPVRTHAAGQTGPPGLDELDVHPHGLPAQRAEGQRAAVGQIEFKAIQTGKKGLSMGASLQSREGREPPLFVCRPGQEETGLLPLRQALRTIYDHALAPFAFIVPRE